MIRLIIAAIGVFLIWLLFFSGVRKKTKLMLGFAALFLVAFSIWLEGYLKTPREGLIAVQEVSSCGVSASHSYRSNYNIDYCLENHSNEANVRRIELRFVAQDCDQQGCIEKDSATKDRDVNIAAGQSQQLRDNLAFDSIQDHTSKLDWKLEIISVKAKRQ